MILTSLAAGAVALAGALAAGTAVKARAIDRRFPPEGRFETIDGVRIHFVETRPADDDGRLPVVLIHGASGNLAEPRGALGDRLADRRLLLVDRPGHGHSGRRGDLSSPAAPARILAGLMDRLGIGRAIVVGHSLGGSIAAAMGVLHPDKVAGLVFVAPATHPWPGGIAWYYTAATMPLVGRLFTWTLALPGGSSSMSAAAAGVFAPEPMPPDYVERARLPLVLRPRSFRANAEDVANLKPHLQALSPRYGEIRAPTVVVTGDSDGVVLARIHSEGLKRDISGADLVVLPGVGHMPHHTRPDAVIAAIETVERRTQAEASA